MSLPLMHEYLSFEHADVLLKTAGEKAKRVAKTVGSGLAGMGLGYLAGGGAMRLADKIHGKPIPSSSVIGALPILGAASGLAYNLYKAQEAEEIRRALESSNHQPAGSVPG
jgi:uncharacterized membrane protein YebE (DUF533 family)